MISRLDSGLEITLRRAEALVGAARGLALSLEDLTGIELPPLSGAQIDQAQLRAFATLYLAAELESAGLIQAAESLAGLTRTASLPVDLGEAAPLLHAFWQERRARASAEERLGFLSGLFGSVGGPDDSERPSNREFEERMIDLCEALYKLDEQANNANWGGVAQQARVRSAAQRLVENLVRVSGGITVFMAQEILVTLRQVIAILNHPAIRAAFGARMLWDVVDAIDRRLRRPRQDHSLHVRRGQAGMTILAWLADAVPALEGSSKPLVGLDHPVIEAAVEWLEASLSMTEAETKKAPLTPRGSTWSALAG